MRGMRACADPKLRKVEVYSASPQRAKGKGGSIAYASCFAQFVSFFAISNAKPQTVSLYSRNVGEMLDHRANRVLSKVDAKISVLVGSMEAAHQRWAIPVREMARILFRVL